MAQRHLANTSNLWTYIGRLFHQEIGQDRHGHWYEFFNQPVAFLRHVVVQATTESLTLNHRSAINDQQRNLLSCPTSVVFTVHLLK
jgi:hypothetical protein